MKNFIGFITWKNLLTPDVTVLSMPGHGMEAAVSLDRWDD